MRYVKKVDANKIDWDSNWPSIHATGSVIGMQKLYSWPKGGQVRVGQYIYNMGIAEIKKLRDMGILRGE